MARYDHHTGFPVEQYLDSQRFNPTCCMFVPRAVFEDVGLLGHRLESGVDEGFGNQVHDAGYDLQFAADVTMYHQTRNSLRAHIKKDLRVGRGLCQPRCYHPDYYATPGVAPTPSGVRSPNAGDGLMGGWRFRLVGILLTPGCDVRYFRECFNLQSKLKFEQQSSMDDS
jgi:hypothetical protein